jgi:hypothetical protein
MPVREWLDVQWRMEREAGGGNGTGTTLRKACRVEQPQPTQKAPGWAEATAEGGGAVPADGTAADAPPPVRLAVQFELSLRLCD